MELLGVKFLDFGVSVVGSGGYVCEFFVEECVV